MNSLANDSTLFHTFGMLFDTSAYGTVHAYVSLLTVIICFNYVQVFKKAAHSHINSV